MPEEPQINQQTIALLTRIADQAENTAMEAKKMSSESLILVTKQGSALESVEKTMKEMTVQLREMTKEISTLSSLDGDRRLENLEKFLKKDDFKQWLIDEYALTKNTVEKHDTTYLKTIGFFIGLSLLMSLASFYFGFSDWFRSR